ncbi:hypothetical protein GWK47_027988 [Chionoecetes opilio]|uniref:Uncharacterized protein n=1 Tax=Chionoecetes opilio TaxID=41210 RepID=A0A8J5D5W9_CHIOP|nr:hypothetical protein GWK47_027988 [Chionoecetes opilio]
MWSARALPYRSEFFPAAVTKFLHTLLTGSVSVKLPLKKLNFCHTLRQDWVFAFPSGKKSPKHYCANVKFLKETQNDPNFNRFGPLCVLSMLRRSYSPCIQKRNVKGEFHCHKLSPFVFKTRALG